MNHYKVAIALVLWLSSLAMVAIATSRVATRKAKEKYDPFTVEEIIKFGSFWQYTTARQYSDGGSWDIGFLEGNGYWLYVRVDYSLGVKHDYRRFYLRKSLLKDGGEFVEIARGSELESKVIALIDNAMDLNTEECKVLPDKEDIVDLLKSRDVRVIIDDPRE